MLTSQGCILMFAHLLKLFSWLHWELSSRWQHSVSLLNLSLTPSTSPQIGIMACIIYTPRSFCLHTALFPSSTPPVSSALLTVARAVVYPHITYSCFLCLLPGCFTFAINAITYVNAHLCGVQFSEHIAKRRSAIIGRFQRAL